MKNKDLEALFRDRDGVPVYSRSCSVAAVAGLVESSFRGLGVHNVACVFDTGALLEEGGVRGLEAVKKACLAFEDMQILHNITLLNFAVLGDFKAVAEFCCLHSYYLEWNEGGDAWTLLQVVTVKDGGFSVRRDIYRGGVKTTARAAKNSLRRLFNPNNCSIEKTENV